MLNSVQKLFRIAGLTLSLNNNIKKLFLGALAVGLLNVSLALFVPELNGRIIDSLTIKDRGLFEFNLMLTLIVIFTMAITHYFQMYINNSLSETVGRKYRDQIARSVFNKQLIEIESIIPGDFISKVASDVDLVKGFLSEIFLASILNIVTVIWITIILLFKQPSLTVLVITVIATSIVIGKLLSSKIEELVAISRRYFSTLINTFSQTIQDLIPIKMYRVENQFLHKFNQANDDFVKVNLSIAKVSSWISTSNFLFLSIPSLLVLGIGGFSVVNGSLSVGQIVAAIMLCAYLLSPLQSLISTLTISVPGAYPIFERISSHLKVHISENSSHAELQAIESIQYQNLEFNYGPHNFGIVVDSFTVKKGEIVGIIGSNGMGKSTLGKLLQGIYTPAKGDICALANGLVKKLNSADLETISVMVTKRDFISLATIKENLTLFDSLNESAPISDLINRFRLEENISSDWGVLKASELPRKLSDGERQMIILIRAFSLNRSMIIFDEPELSLDHDRVEVLKKVLTEKSNSRITVVITHSNELIQCCHKVYQLNRISANNSELKEVV